jgi:L-lactate dehydrogenase complex protein LldG
MTSRDTVLGSIRRSLGVKGGEAARRAAVGARLDGTPAGVIPARGKVDAEGRVALFTKYAEKTAATVARVSDADAVPLAVADFLRAHNLPSAVRMGDDGLVAGLPWEKTQIEVSRGPADPGDAVSVSHAVAGVAESGTLILTSGAANPTTLNFLPETHIVVLKAADIDGDYESVWVRLRAVYGKGVMPRTVNMITGPSRSGDIEQTILLGAHGPRRLHIILVG